MSCHTLFLISQHQEILKHIIKEQPAIARSTLHRQLIAAVLMKMSFNTSSLSRATGRSALSTPNAGSKMPGERKAELEWEGLGDSLLRRTVSCHCMFSDKLPKATQINSATRTPRGISCSRPERTLSVLTWLLEHSRACHSLIHSPNYPQKVNLYLIFKLSLVTNVSSRTDPVHFVSNYAYSEFL